ncbi:MAG: ANTAR domain-containing response regulator [Granulosicoccus sp.]
MHQPLTLSGQSALILHDEDQSRRKLVTALDRLRIQSTVMWPMINGDAESFNVVFFDVDKGHDEQFPWEAGASPVPLIALIGSEAPGRIEWAMSHAASAYLLKPVQSSGVFSALTIAFHNHALKLEQSRHLDTLTMRLKARPLVLKAVLDEMRSCNIDDDTAFRNIRSRSMQCQMNVEEYCAYRLSQSSATSTQPRTGAASSKAQSGSKD